MENIRQTRLLGYTQNIKKTGRAVLRVKLKGSQAMSGTVYELVVIMFSTREPTIKHLAGHNNVPSGVLKAI